MSGLFAFDPDAHIAEASAAVRAAPPSSPHLANLNPILDRSPRPPAPPAHMLETMPASWRSGLAWLTDMPAPLEAKPERWAQIVNDAIVFAEGWGAEAAARGWTIENVFGFEMEQPDGLMGLALHIRDGRVTFLGDQWAEVRKAGGGFIHVEREMPAKSRLLWQLHRGRKR